MVPALLAIFAAAGATKLFISLFSEEEENPKFPSTGNCHDFFLGLESRANLSASEWEACKEERNNIQKAIRAYFRTLPTIPVPNFYIQGSYKMDTMVPDFNNAYDIDVGIYFLQKPQLTPATLQAHICKAIANFKSNAPTQHRNKCVRLVINSRREFDFPVYYKTPKDAHPFLATKTGWIESDPKELCDWFKSRVNENRQIVRIIKYFKLWSRKQASKMPSGLALTVWAVKFYEKNVRDDLAFFHTIKSMRVNLDAHLECTCPVVPFDDLLARLDQTQKTNFLRALKLLEEVAQNALVQEVPTDAERIWRNIL